MSKRVDILADGIFQPILPLTLMCDSVTLDPSNPLMVAVVGPGPSILNIDPATLGLTQPRPTRDQLTTMVLSALESARGSEATRQMLPMSEGVSAVQAVATFFLWSMETPFPVYRFITNPLNVSGTRSKEALEQQLPLMKLLCIAHRAIPRNSTLWYSGALYRGIDKDLNPVMRRKYDAYETEFEVGSMITFPAPTSCTISDAVAGGFTKGIQLVIQKASGVRLSPGQLSAYDEAEVMPPFPSCYVVTARSKVQDTVVVVIEARPSHVSYCSIPQDTFFENELVYKQSRNSPKICQCFMSFYLDRSSRNCTLKLQKLKGGMKGLFLAAAPSKRHFGEYRIMAPGSSFNVTKSSQFNFCITICLPKTGDQLEASIIIGFSDLASFEKTQICFQMGLSKSARARGGIGRYADPELKWDWPIPHEHLFMSAYTATAQEFCARYGCLCSLQIRRCASQMGSDVKLLCNSIKEDVLQVLQQYGVKLDRDIESSKSSINFRGPHIHWHLNRVWYEVRCKSARVIQRKYRELRLIKKLLANRDDSFDAMDVKPRRVSSYLRPFRDTHVDDKTASQLQLLLNLHAGWLGFGEIRESLRVLFAAPLEGIVAPSSGNPPFEWLVDQYLIIVPEFVVILGKNISEMDANFRKFSFQDDIPELFVRQVVPISQIHEVVLSTCADNAMIFKVSGSAILPHKWGFADHDTLAHDFCAKCLSKFHIFKRRHVCFGCKKVFCNSCCPSEMRTFPAIGYDSPDHSMLSRSCFECYFLEPRVDCFDVCMRSDYRTDCLVALQQFKAERHNSVLFINLKPRAEVNMTQGNVKMPSIPVIFGKIHPSQPCIYIPSEEIEFPVEQVKKIQKCIEDGRRSKERIELIRRLYPRIQQESPELLNFLQTNIKIFNYDDEQLIGRIFNHNMLPSFIRDEISCHTHDSEDILFLENELCLYLCRRVRSAAVAVGNNESHNIEVGEQHSCQFQVQDLEHCFVDSLFSPKEAPKLDYDIALLSVADIERIIKERGQNKQSSVREVNVQESLALIKSLCINFGDSQLNFMDCDEPVLLIGNTGCGKSTAVNFLLGRKMDQTRSEEGRRVVVVASSESEVSSIGHSSGTSKTLLPQFLNSANSIASPGPPLPKFSFADFPGFNDSRGFEFNVANCTNLKSYLRLCSSGIRILFLVDRCSIKSDRGKSIRDSVCLLNSMFSGNIDRIQFGVCVCLTKIQFKESAVTGREYDEDVGDLRADIRFFCSEFSKELFELTADQIKYLDPLSDFRDDFINECICELTPIMCPASFFSPSLSDSDKYQVQQLLERIQLDIEMLIKGDRPSEAFVLCDLAKRFTDLGFEVIDHSYKRIQKCVEEGLERMCKSTLLLIDAHDPIQLLRNSVIDTVREILQSAILQDCFPDSRIAALLSDFKTNVQEREIRQQQQVDDSVSSELSGLLQDFKSFLSCIDAHDPVAELACSITDPSVLNLSKCSPSFHSKAFPIHDLMSNIQIELKNRCVLYCNPSLERLQELSTRLDFDSKRIILSFVENMSRVLRTISLEKIFTELNMSIEDAVKRNCTDIWTWLKSRPLNDLNLSRLSSLGFRPQHIDQVNSTMIAMRDSDTNGYHNASLLCSGFLKCLETYTRKIQLNFLKSRIVGVDFAAVGLPLHVQGCDVECVLNDLYSMNAHAERAEMLEYLAQTLLVVPQRKIEAAVQSPDPVSYRRDISHNLQLLQMASSIPSISSVHQVTHEIVLNSLRRSEQSKLEGHLENARSSISARLKEFRADCQNPIELSPVLQAALIDASSPNCLASIHLHLGFHSASNLIDDLAEAQRNLDSVENMYTPDAIRYPIFCEFEQFLADMRREIIIAIQHFEVVCTAEIETQKLFKKLSKLWADNPRVLLDTKDKTINTVRDGLTASDWSAIDEIERKGKLSDAKARMYAEKYIKFMNRFEVEALDRILCVASHDIADFSERIPEWLSRRCQGFCSSPEDSALDSVKSSLFAGLEKYVGPDMIADKIKSKDFSGLASMMAVVSKLKIALLENGFIQLKTLDSPWELEQKLVRSLGESITALIDPTVDEVKHLFQLSSDLETIRKERFKLKSLLHFCTCYRAPLKDSPAFKQVIQDVSEEIFSRVQPIFKGCIQAHGDRFSGIVAVKFLHFTNLCDGVFDGIQKSSIIETLTNRIKASSCISDVSESVFALRDHKDFGAAANIAIDIFPAFRRMNIQLYNKKAGQMTVQKVLDELKTQSNPDESLSALEKQLLSESFEAYQRVYDDTISELISEFGNPETKVSAKTRVQDKSKREALILSQTIMRNARNLKKERVNVGKMLGYMFAAWTIVDTDASDSSTDAANFKETLLQPHATQIITIMRILGVDSSGVAQNHLAEVKTGEGKSITLGALSIVFALLGYSVNVVCYNPYLSTRDWEIFKKLFDFFGLTSSCVNSSIGISKCCITYCTIDNLVSLLMNDGSIPNICDVVLDILSDRPCRSAEIKLQQQNKVLLIDEVDVFFGQDFFGQCQRVGMIDESKESKDLLKYIFDNRAALLSDPDVEGIMRHETVQKLTRRYPRLLQDDLLKQEIRAMLRDLQDFPADGSINHTCVVSKDKQNIGYMDKKMAGVNFNQYFGYKTFFAYLYYCSTTDQSKKLDIHKDSRRYGLQLLAGSVLYSELPKCFGTIHGLSGTVRYLGQNESKILDQYKFERRSYVPSTFQKRALSQLDPLNVMESPDEHDFFHGIRDEIKQKLEANRTTLIVFGSFAQLKRFHTFMENRAIKHDDYRLPEMLHDEMNDAQRDGVISRSMNRHAITLMTKSFGRGTDFKCHNKQIDTAGGVHVVLTYLPQSMSEKVQIQGRTCRQDYQGSFREMFWAQDLQELGFVNLSSGRVDLEGRLGASAMRDLLEAKRMELDDRQRQEMFNSLESNTQLWQKTCDMLNLSTRPNLDAAFAILNEIQPCPAVVQPIEVAFLFDATKSMGPYILAAKERVMNIANDVKRGVAAANRRIKSEDLDEYVKFAFVGYRDWNASGKVYDAPGHVESFDLSSDIKNLRAFIEQVKPHGGGDLAEDVAGGLRAIESLKWSSDSAKCVFMLADAPCHGNQYHSMKDSFESSSVFNAAAGQTRFDKSVARDEHHNVVGSQYDLSPDGAFNGHIIAVYQAFTGEGFTFNEPKAALEKKGFTVVLWHGELPPIEEFQKTLEKSCQLWLVSTTNITLSEQYIQAVLQFVEARKGLFLWGDNDPYHGDANAIISRLPFFKGTVSLAGNFHGDKILAEHSNPQNMRSHGPYGFKPHYITTGLESLYEGITISDIRDPLQLCDPIITCSDGRSHVTCLYSKDRHRVLIDGGFTRLLPDRWARTAGTSRFVTNAACFLAAFEDKADNFPEGDPQGSVPERQIESLVSTHSIKFFFVNICREKTDQMIRVWNEHLDSKKMRAIETFELDHAGVNFLDNFAAQISSAILADYTSVLKRQ